MIEIAPKRNKSNKRVKSGPKKDGFAYGSREWYTSDVGGKKPKR